MDETPSFHNENNGPIHNLVQARQIVFERDRLPPPDEVAFHVHHWVNHESFMDALVAHLAADAPVPLLVPTSPGLGASTLIGVTAARVRDRFPGGQVLITIGPDSPAAAARQFIERRQQRDLLPSGDGDPSTLFRTVLGREKVLLVVDGARHHKHADFFRTGLPNVALVVIGHGFDHWPGAESRPMPTLSHDHARQLVSAATTLPDDDVAALVAGFGPRPKTLLDAAAIVQNQTGQDRIGVAELVAMAGDDEVARLFLGAFENLGADGRTLHRALRALAPSGIEDALVEALDGPALDQLKAHRLIEDTGRGHWRLRTGESPALRAEDLPEPVRRELRRVLGWYLRRAQLADATIVRRRTRVGVPEPIDCPDFGAEADLDAARARAHGWFTDHHRLLFRLLKTASLLEWHRETWSLADALWSYYSVGGHQAEALRCYELAAVAAEGDHRAQTRMTQLLGKLQADARDWDRARATLERAFALALETADPVLIGTSLEFIGRLHYKAGRLVEAIDWLRRAEANAREGGDARSIGLQTRFLGEAHRDLGEAVAARRYFVEALGCFEVVGDRRGVAIVSLEVALLEAREGAEQAGRRFEEAMGDLRELGMVRYEAQGHHRFGLLRTGERRRRHLDSALKLYEVIGDPAADEIRRELG